MYKPQAAQARHKRMTLNQTRKIPIQTFVNRIFVTQHRVIYSSYFALGPHVIQQERITPV